MCACSCQAAVITSVSELRSALASAPHGTSTWLLIASGTYSLGGTPLIIESGRDIRIESADETGPPPIIVWRARTEPTQARLHACMRRVALTPLLLVPGA